MTDAPPPPPTGPYPAGPPDLPPSAAPPDGPGSAPSRWLVPLAVVAAVGLLVGAFGAGWALRGGDDGGPDEAATPDRAPVDVEADSDDRPTEPPLDTSELAEEPVAAVADAVAPTVVQIETASGVGSGVIYDPDGLVLTANHVIERTDEVVLRLADGTRLDGTVVGGDAESDIGVVAIEDPPRDLPVAVLADSPPDVGDLAVAVGSPFALDQTVTAGVVSAVDRPAPPGGPSVGTIQTDAPINPGNSGGPLASREGEVMGINSFIQTQSGGNIGLGFAVPVDIAERVADALVAGEPVAFGYLGIEGANAVGEQSGALVAAVVPGSPADDAGLEAGDVVVAIDGETITSFGELGIIVRRQEPGTELELTVVRGGDEQQVTVTLGSTAG